MSDVSRRVLAGVAAALLVGAATATQGQRPPAGTGRRATTVAALASYPVFFHAQTVRVRGELVPGREAPRLRAGEHEVIVAGPVAATATPSSGEVEVLGRFFDVGRLEPDDPRLREVDISEVWTRLTGRSWPGVGELTLIAAERIGPAEPLAAPSIRTLALDPERYTGQRVTVTGRFRGLNLYGDLPDAPAGERDYFVLQSAEAAVWVVGLRPRGDGFRLNPSARVDTGRWLEVSGTARVSRGVAVIQGASVALAAEPAADATAEPAAIVPTVGPRPEVVFSTPTARESDVSPDVRVRIQFSRDIVPESIRGQVQVSYVVEESVERGEAQPPALTVTTAYAPGNRVLELRFAEPLARFRVVKVELLEGIRALDGAALVPFVLTFTVGG